MEYAGNHRFHLSFMRHTGQWVELYTGLSLDECLAAIRLHLTSLTLPAKVFLRSLRRETFLFQPMPI